MRGVDKGIPWQGPTPESWAVGPIRRFLSVRKEVVGERWTQIQLLSLTKQGVILRDPASGEGKFPASFEGYQRVRPGDLIMCLFDVDETPRTVGISPYEGMVTSAYTRFHVNASTASPRFIEWAFVAIDDAKRFRPLYSGLRKVIQKPRLLAAPMALPPLAEQRAIADYLDRETAKIDTLIDKQTTMIDRLRERRARVIEAAIRRGLDLTVELQDSQDVALGMVPAHWRVCRMKHVGRPIIGLTYSPEEVVSETEGVLVLRAGNIQAGQIDLTDTVYVSTPLSATLRAMEGDILICARNGSAALIGKNAVIPEELAGQTWGAFMVVLRSPLNGYLRWFLNSAVFRAQTGQFATTTINQLTTRTLGNLVVALPPLAEQRAIADYLDRETAKIDALITKVERHIELAKERRAALITAAVTGQIDVTNTSKSGDAA